MGVRENCVCVQPPRSAGSWLPLPESNGAFPGQSRMYLPIYEGAMCRLFPSCQPCRELTLYVLARGPLFGRIGAIQREAPPARATPTTPYSQHMPIRSPGKETRFILRPPATWRTPDGGQADRGLVRIETTIQTRDSHPLPSPCRGILWLNIMFVRKGPANRIDRAWY